MSIQAYNLYDINSQSEFLKCDKAKRIESKAIPKRIQSEQKATWAKIKSYERTSPAFENRSPHATHTHATHTHVF